jgi:hypothetical protein
MQYTPSLHDSGWFTVQMLDLQIAGSTIGTDKSVYNRGKGVIVDSGTTDTYMPTGCAAGFKARWKEVRKGLDFDSLSFFCVQSLL